MAPGDDHDPGDAALDERAEVLQLVDDLRRAAEHARVAGGGEAAFERLGEDREDRVVELGHDDADEPGLERAATARGAAAPSSSTARRTTAWSARSRPGVPFMTRLTVASLTPASSATSRQRTRTAAIVATVAHVLQGMQDSCYVCSGALPSSRRAYRCAAGAVHDRHKGDPCVPAPFRVTALSLLAALLARRRLVRR